MNYEVNIQDEKNDNQKENSNSFFKDNSNKSSVNLDKSNKLTIDDKQELTDQDEELNEQTMKNLTNSIDLLIKAATLENPKQFQLPLEYTPPIQLPGTSRKPYINSFSGQINHVNKTKKQIYEFENGQLTLPVKTCFKCDRSCRKTCLIQCDFCPLLYCLGMNSKFTIHHLKPVFNLLILFLHQNRLFRSTINLSTND